MVVYVIKWNIRPGAGEAYSAFTQRAVPATVGAPGLVEFRGYRPASGAHQVVVTYEFADMEGWAGWYRNEDVQDALEELRNLATDVETVLWGPSPVVPEPVRPGG